MPIPSLWIIRELAARLRQPAMRPQRRFMAAVSLMLALFLIGAVIYLFRQPTEDAMERAALKVFAVMGMLIAIFIAAAVVIRKRTRDSRTQGESPLMTGERSEEQLQQPKIRS